MKWLLSKKFVISLLALGLCFAALVLGKISGQDFTNTVYAILATFTVANVATSGNKQ